MKYLKTFNEGLNSNDIRDDIRDIFIELIDDHTEIDVDVNTSAGMSHGVWSEDWGIIIDIISNNIIIRDPSAYESIKECFERLMNYIKNIKVRPRIRVEYSFQHKYDKNISYTTMNAPSTLPNNNFRRLRISIQY